MEVVVFFILIGIVVFVVNVLKKSKETENKLSAYFNKVYKLELNIPNDAQVVHYIEGDPGFDKYVKSLGDMIKIRIPGDYIEMLCWEDSGELAFSLGLDAFSEYSDKWHSLEQDDIYRLFNKTNTSFSFKKEEIKGFSTFGNMFTKVSGGGYDLGGALVGGVIAGGAGAIIGSRESISTEVVDERNTVLLVNENSKFRALLFTYQAIKVFLKIIPEKSDWIKSL